MTAETPTDDKAQNPKVPIRKRIAYVILVLLSAFLMLDFGLGRIFSSQGMGYLVYNQLLEQRNQVGNLTAGVLANSLLEPGERLTRWVSKDIDEEIATWGHYYPDIIGVHIIEEKRLPNHLPRGNTPVYGKIIEQTIPPMLDTLQFINCPWDSTCQFANQWINIEDYRLLCSFFRTPTQTFLVVRNTEKLKQGISAILDKGQNRFPLFYQYFQPFPRFGAQIKFLDEGYNEFCTYGNPRGRGWDEILNTKVPYLPWKMKVQIFPEQTHLLDAASSKNKIDIRRVLVVIIGVLSVLMIGWFGRGFWWEGKKPSSRN